MSTLTTDLATQYGTSEKLAARARLHRDFTVSEGGWFEWFRAAIDAAFAGDGGVLETRKEMAAFTARKSRG